MPTSPVDRSHCRSKDRDGTPTGLPRTLLRPAILVLLREQDNHGYAIIERLCDLGLAGTDSGGMYRALRALEEEGAVRSRWADAERGAPRRVYTITGDGRRELTRALDGLERQRAVLDELVARQGRPAPSGAATGTREYHASTPAPPGITPSR